MALMTMAPSGSQGKAVELAKHRNTPAQLKELLRQRGVYTRFLSLSPGRLLKLPIKKFESYLRLFTELKKVGGGQDYLLLALITPSLDALIAIDVDALMQNRESWKQIVQACYRPEEGKIDLTQLVWINAKYRGDVSQPPVG